MSLYRFVCQLRPEWIQPKAEDCGWLKSRGLAREHSSTSSALQLEQQLWWKNYDQLFHIQYVATFSLSLGTSSFLARNQIYGKTIKHCRVWNMSKKLEICFCKFAKLLYEKLNLLYKLCSCHTENQSRSWSLVISWKIGLDFIKRNVSQQFGKEIQLN